MYLKSLEVQGFKSFSNKLVFEFHNGITAIVGPNGSGKSNVADSVRWVLGEQSAKQLRGAKMEDIIFAGTELRKPLGYAYVAITINNEDHKLDVDYEEVKIARRVYRSGESEYLLNGTTCRLKDIQELLFDTGIGKEGYSIIGQGQIDRILSGKPEERRELFDEAAGIVKFKKRKAAAEKSLAEEQQNMVRIEDILSEQEKRIGPLEKQSEKARQFLLYRDELRGLDVNMYLMEYDELSRQLEEVRRKQEIASSDLERANQELKQSKAVYLEVDRSISNYEKELEQCRTDLDAAREQKNTGESNSKIFQEQIRAALESEKDLEGQIQKLEASIADAQKEREGYQQKENALEERLDGLRQKQKETEKRLEEVKSSLQQATQEIADRNNEILTSANEMTQVKSDQQRLKAMLEQNSVDKARLTQEVLRLKSNEATLEETMEKQKNILDGLSEQIDGMDANISENKSMIHQLQRQSEELEQEYRGAQKDYHMANARLSSLQNMAERYEGYGQSIRRVMEQKDHNPGIIGVVADIIHVDQEYEVAIETALGGSIQNIVTDHEQTAKTMINFLKKNRYGRATFLPLTSISGRELERKEQILKETGVVGTGASLVKAEPRFAKLITYLLGRIVVVDHIDHAIALAGKYHHSLRIVTKEGELLNPGGSMSGGAYKNSHNLLGRQHEMESLKKEVAEKRNRIREVQQKQEQCAQNQGKQREERDKNLRLRQELEIEQNTARINYDRSRGDFLQNQEELSKIGSRSSEIENKKRELTAELERLTNSVAENEQRKKDNDERLIALNQSVSELKVQETTLTDENTTLKLKLSTESQSGSFARQNIERIDQALANDRRDLGDLQERKKNLTAQVEEKKLEIQRGQTAIEEAIEQINHLEERIETVQQERERLTLQHKDYIDRREQLSNQAHELDNERIRLANQEEKLNTRQNNRTDYMWEEYELTYHTAEELRTDTSLSLEEMKEKTGTLKAQIKGLGDVNVNAVEEYQEVMESYTKLKKQHDDLIAAADKLREVILELDESMRTRFESQFEEIRTRFDQVFKELFGGGRGTLELQEDEDLLTAGIKINAQPPGKKLQNMMQLSGGEKALTAISLLFAIQSLKPSPFCLLDEIEAALDDSNVDRYAKYLHKLTKDTQFIVITHRRGTMNAADILYGITMQEKGVSTLVSVNMLDEKDLVK